MATSFTPTITPTSKERKYDRQLRLWAASGQSALEQARVLLINTTEPLDSLGSLPSGVAGVETLKNLVLPGVGGFTIVDHAIVKEEDLGVNFFLEDTSLGKNRGEETCRLLKELNPDVEGDCDARSIWALLADTSFLPRFSLILLTAPVPHAILSQISQSAHTLNIPLIYIHSTGFYGTFSLQLPPVYPIVETHPPADAIQDLHLTNPWPELAHEAHKLRTGEGRGDGTKPLERLDDYEHGHVPWLLLLLHYLETWKATHDGAVPRNYAEKTEFRSLVASGARTNNAEGGEENFDEACGAVLKAVSQYTLRDELRDIFSLQETLAPKPGSASFFVIAHGIKAFYERYGALPLSGVLPDMKAKSQEYVRLQRLYKEKAARDVAEVTKTVRQLEASWTEAGAGEREAHIPESEIAAFCKNAAHVQVIHGRRIPVFEARKVEDGSDDDSSEDALEAKRMKMDIDPMTPARAPTTPTAVSTNFFTIDDTTQSALRNAMDFGIEDSLVPVYIATQVLDNIVSQHDQGLLPNLRLEAPIGVDIALEKAYADALRGVCTAVGMNVPAPFSGDETEELAECRKALEEVRRAGGGELHNVAALMGGMVAQEGLKVLTRQYVPVNNTVVFDGVRGRTMMYKL